MSNLILIFLCSLPFSHFLLKRTDIWHAHGHWFQVGLLFLFCWSFFEKPKRVTPINKPLGALFCWMGLITAYHWISTIVLTKNYATVVFFPLFNFLCFILFYQLCVGYLERKDVDRIILWLRWVVFAVICYSLLQALNLDQFYAPLNYPKGFIGEDSVVGVIGNATHNAGYLAICSPLYFKKGWLNVIAYILMWVVILLTRSASGVLVAFVVFILFLLYKRKFLWAVLLVLASLAGYLQFRVHLSEFLSSTGRFEMWRIFWGKFQQKPITGWGLGATNVFNFKDSTTTPWKHVHCEYLQVLLEVGIVALALVGWGIASYFRRAWRLINDELSFRLSLMFVGFLVFGLFLFPAHLWLLASLGMISYSLIYVLENKEQ